MLSALNLTSSPLAVFNHHEGFSFGFSLLTPQRKNVGDEPTCSWKFTSACKPARLVAAFASRICRQKSSRLAALFASRSARFFGLSLSLSGSVSSEKIAVIPSARNSAIPPAFLLRLVIGARYSL